MTIKKTAIPAIVCIQQQKRINALVDQNFEFEIGLKIWEDALLHNHGDEKAALNAINEQEKYLTKKGSVEVDEENAIFENSIDVTYKSMCEIEKNASFDFKVSVNSSDNHKGHTFMGSGLQADGRKVDVSSIVQGFLRDLPDGTEIQLTLSVTGSPP